MTSRRTAFLARGGAGLAGLMMLAGCAGGGSGLTETVRAAQGGAADPNPQDFVVQSRTAAPTGYIPVGVTPPSRETPVKAAGDVTKLEKELDGQRDRAKAFARRPAPKSTYDGSIPRPSKAPPPVPAPPEQD